MFTLQEGCLPAVDSVIPMLVDEIEGFLTGKRNRRISIGLDERSRKDA
jgi:hypothetical protein